MPPCYPSTCGPQCGSVELPYTSNVLLVATVRLCACLPGCRFAVITLNATSLTWRSPALYQFSSLPLPRQPCLHNVGHLTWNDSLSSHSSTRCLCTGQSLRKASFSPSSTRPAIAAASAHALSKAQTYLANAEDIIARADYENKPLRATGLLTIAAIAVLGARDSVAHHAALDANLAAQAERLEAKLALTQKNFSDLQQELEVTLPACGGGTVSAAPIDTASFQQPEETPTPSSSSHGTQTDSEKAEANVDTEQSIHTRDQKNRAKSLECASDCHCWRLAAN